MKIMLSDIIQNGKIPAIERRTAAIQLAHDVARALKAKRIEEVFVFG